MKPKRDMFVCEFFAVSIFSKKLCKLFLIILEVGWGSGDLSKNYMWIKDNLLHYTKKKKLAKGSGSLPQLEKKDRKILVHMQQFLN